ncbi:hypothetical protein TKK_0010828 [Trichogramma kaykai]
MAEQCILGRSQRYRIAGEGLWYFDQRQDKWKLSVPKGTRPRVLHDFHDAAGHPGEDETYRAIAVTYLVSLGSLCCNDTLRSASTLEAASSFLWAALSRWVSAY